MKKLKYINKVVMLLVITAIVLTGCGSNTSDDSSNTNSNNNTKSTSSSSKSSTTTLTSVDGAIYSASDLFTDRDLEQTADLTDATTYTVKNGEDITITKEGVYVLTGTATNVTVYVEVDDEEKVQIVLDDVSITNTDFPCIYVKSGDKIFITTTDSENTLKVTETFKADGSTNTDGVIFSRSDLVLNGTGSLTIESTDNGIVSKDDLKVTGGTYNITASSKAIEANDSIRIADGTFNLNAGTDGLHAENDDDNSLGYVFIGGGKFNITSGDDGIHAQTVVQIDDGDLTINAVEGIEGTYVQINGGIINITASDDGINAANKSNAYRTTIEINDGDITISMGAGDTDGVDSNGDIYVNGGTINVTGNSTFDYDGTAEYNGGTIIVNGTQIDYILNQMMGGGNMNGNMGGNGPGGNMGVRR